MNNLEKELEEKIASAQSDDEVIAIFVDAGIHVSVSDLDAETSLENDELDENALSAVSGGSLWGLAKKLWNAWRYNAGGSGFSSGGGGKGAFGGGGVGGSR